LLGRVSALRRDKALPKLDPARETGSEDVDASSRSLLRVGAAHSGMGAPPLYADPEFPGTSRWSRASAVDTPREQSLSGRSPLELAFLAGRHLSWHREEHFVRLLVPSTPDLEDLFLAALSIANQSIPLSRDQAARGASRQGHRTGARAGRDRPRPRPFHAIHRRRRAHEPPSLGDRGRTNRRAHGLSLANDLAYRPQGVRGSTIRATADSKMDDLIILRHQRPLRGHPKADRPLHLLERALTTLSVPDGTRGGPPNPTCSGGRGQSPR